MARHACTSYPSRDLIRRRRKLCECLLEIDGDGNLVIQRARLLPCAGHQRVRAGKVEIGRNGRPAVDHVAETDNAVLLAAYTIVGNDQGEWPPDDDML